MKKLIIIIIFLLTSCSTTQQMQAVKKADPPKPKTKYERLFNDADWDFNVRYAEQLKLIREL